MMASSSSRKGSKRSRGNADDADFAAPTPIPKKSRRSSSAATNGSLPPSGEEEMEEEDSLSQMCSQDEREAKKAGGHHVREAEAGVIEKIDLTDFMCHRRLQLELSPNVNFILGRNGSGKSAIMLAIMVALGSKAASTHRNSSLKQFIRTGSSVATVKVVLRNRGSEAFKWDEYGDRIEIHRTLRADGAGEYKIKGARGQVISTKKDELLAILDHCNIQIDNPVSLLSQDTSRNFLHSSNPGAKYKLFMKATHLEQIAQDYERSKEHQEIMKSAIEKKVALMPELKRKAKELEEKVEEFDRLKDMEDKLQAVERELQWALVIEIEKAVPPIESDIERAKERIPRNKQRAQAAERQVKGARMRLSELENELKGVMREAQGTNERRTAKYTEKRQQDKEMREFGTKLKSKRRAVVGVRGEKAALEQRRGECIAASQRDTRGEREARLSRLEGAREELVRAENELGTVSHDHEQFGHALTHTTREMKDIESKVGDLNAEVRSAEEQLHRLQSSRQDPLQAFGAWMGHLVTALRQNAHHFHKPPKGPLGAMIKLKDYKWARAVECVLGFGTLAAFIVDNQEDGRTFKSIMRKVLRSNNFKPDAIATRFEGRPHDVGPHRARGPHPTVLDLVVVDDPDVLNALVEERSIERILLIASGQEARRVMEDGSCPPNAREAYTLEGDQVMTRGFYSNKRQQRGILRASADEAIRVQEARVGEVKEERQRRKSQLDELRNNAGRSKRLLSECRGRMSEKQRRVNNLNRAINELQTVEEEEAQEDIGTYDDEIQACEDRIKELTDEQKVLEENMRLCREDLKRHEEAIAQLDTEAGSVAEKMEDLQKRQGEVDHDKVTAESKLGQCQERLAVINSTINEMETKAAELRVRAGQAEAAALTVCPRLDTARTSRSIEKEVAQLKRRLEHDQQRSEDVEAVRQQYIDKMKQFEDTQDMINKERKTLKELESSLDRRIGSYQEIRENIGKRSSLYFASNLLQRGYKGELHYKHTEQRLDIKVDVDSTSGSSQAVVKNTRSLSGGERSYTTVCFIMSLWEAMESPFRCMDEFDVFMDMLNRRICMRLMLANAKDQCNRQFIFFTPQDMSSMGVNPDTVKVFKLREPVRDQSTLD